MRLGLPMSLVTGEAKLLCVVFSGYSNKVCAGAIGQWQVSGKDHWKPNEKVGHISYL